MTRSIPALLKEPPDDIGESVVSSNDAVLVPGEPMQRSLSATRSRNVATHYTSLHFYQHDVDWANRPILDDRMTMMVSLARREDLAGKLQMIYMDRSQASGLPRNSRRRWVDGV